MKKDEVVLVFRPPENPAAQVAGITPFKGLRVKLDELIDWFKGLNVDSIELWIEGAWKTEDHTEVFLSLEGKTCAKITLKPIPKNKPAKPVLGKGETSSATELLDMKPDSSTTAGQNPPETKPLGLPETQAPPISEKIETPSTAPAATATSTSTTLKTEPNSSIVESQDSLRTSSSDLQRNQSAPKPQRIRLLIKRFLRHP